MPVPILTEQTIRAHSTPQIFVWGQKDYQQGAVISLIQKDHLIEAEVEDREDIFHFVVIEGDVHQITSARCSCTYEGKGWCKHIVAVLLKYSATEPHHTEQHSRLENLLGQMTLYQLQELVRTLVKQEEHLIKSIETFLFSSTASVSQCHFPHSIHAKVWYRQIHNSFNYGFENDSIQRLLVHISTFILSGEIGNSFTLLELVSEQAVQRWRKYEYEDDYEDEGGIAAFFSQLDQLWAEAILNFHLSLEQREYWESYLNKLESQIVELGGDFTTALNALQYYWDYPPLQEIFSGVREQPLWEEEIRKEKQELVHLYLRLLAQQQRYDAYLRLAQVQQHYKEYIRMVWKLNRFSDVFKGVKQYLKFSIQELYQQRLDFFKKRFNFYRKKRLSSYR